MKIHGLQKKYETAAANEIDMQIIEENVLADGYYLTNEISLKTLASKLEVGQNALSKTINSEFGMNFNDYINQKRVVEAKKRLLNKDFGHLTVEAIGNSVGFNSKSAFYNAFKKHSGTSPSAYVKERKG